MRAKVVLARLGIGITVAVLLLGVVELSLSLVNVFPATLLPSPFGGDHDQLPGTRPLDDPAWLGGCGTGAPRPCRAKKAGLRIAVYGGSAVEGLPYGLYTAFPAWLERYLVRLFPGEPVEVINYGSAGQAIRHIRWQLPLQLPSLKPDMVIIFSGNNEFWEPTARKQLNPSYSAAAERVRHQVWRLSLYRALRQTFVKEKRSNNNTGPPAGGPNDKLATMNEADRRLAADLYRRDLTAIARYSRKIGVPLVLATVADDLRYLHSPPGPEGFPQNRAARKELIRLIRIKDMAGIRSLLEKGGKRGPDHYFMHMAGTLLLKAGFKGPGTEALLQAEYLDPNPQRSNRVMRGIVREVAADEEAHLCDAAGLLNAHGKEGVAGPDLFFDWCHPNPRGHQLLGQIFTRCLAEAGLIKADKQRMHAVFSSMPLRKEKNPYRLDRWPGLFVTSNAEENEDLKCGGFTGESSAHACKGHEEFALRNWDKARGQYRLALERGAEAGPIRFTLSLAAMHDRQPRVALEHVKRAVRLLPDDPDVLNLGAILSPQRP